MYKILEFQNYRMQLGIYCFTQTVSQGITVRKIKILWMKMLQLISLKIIGIKEWIILARERNLPHFSKLLFLNGSGSHRAVFSLLLYCNQRWNLRELFTPKILTKNNYKTNLKVKFWCATSSVSKPLFTYIKWAIISSSLL